MRRIILAVTLFIVLGGAEIWLATQIFPLITAGNWQVFIKAVVIILYLMFFGGLVLISGAIATGRSSGSKP